MYCKVDLSCEKYGWKQFDEELIELRKEGNSLRDLRDYVNFRVLNSSLEEKGIDYPDSMIEKMCDILRDGDQEEVKKTKNRLESENINIEKVKKDFVSHSTIEKHLEECLDIEVKRKESSLEERIDSILALGSRAEKEAQNLLNKERKKNNDIPNGDTRFELNVILETGEIVPFEEIFEEEY